MSTSEQSGNGDLLIFVTRWPFVYQRRLAPAPCGTTLAWCARGTSLIEVPLVSTTPAPHRRAPNDIAGRHHRLTWSLSALVLLAVCASRPARAQAFLRLSASDSVRILATELVHVPGQPPGLSIDYAATSGLADTASLKQRAIAILRAERPRLDSLHLVNFVVRAVDKSSDSTTTLFHRKMYGFVLQHRTDGNWYFLRDPSPVILASDSTLRR